MTKFYAFVVAIWNRYTAVIALQARLGGMIASRNYWRSKYLNTKRGE
jgi:hypothetical protein